MKKFTATLLVSLLFVSVLPRPALSFNQNSATGFLKSQSLDEWGVMALSSANALSGADIGFLNSHPGNGATDLEKRILGRVAAGINSDDLVSDLLEHFNGTEIDAGSGLLNDDIFGLLALSAAGGANSARQKLGEFIKQNQNSDGGWGFAKGGASDSNDTAMAVMALLSGGENAGSNTVNQAFGFIASTKTNTGYSFGPGFGADTASTAWVVSAFYAAGKTPPQSAVNYLDGQQLPNGSFVWQGGQNGNALMTAYATIALKDDYYPVVGSAPPPPPPSDDVDLESRALGITPQNPTAGQTVNFDFWIRENQGDRATKTVLSECRFNGSGFDSWNKSFSAGEHDNSYCPLADAPAGTHTFEICADISNQEAETDESNNCDSLQFTVGGSPPPPGPSDPEFDVAIIGGGQEFFVGQLSFSGFSLRDNTSKNHSFSQPRAIGAVSESGLSYVIKNTSLGLFVDTIAGLSPAGLKGWQYAVNGQKPSIGAADYIIGDGDEIIWFYDDPDASPPPFPGPGGGTERASVNLRAEVTIDQPPAKPTIALSASKTKIKLGEEVQLQWSSQNASHVVSARPSDWARGKVSGNAVMQPIIDTNYRITVGNASATDSAAVNVQVDATPSVVFGVSAKNVNFGSLAPGESAARSITLSNSGTADLDVTAALENADSVYRENLRVGQKKWDKFLIRVNKNSSKSIDLGLSVPSGQQNAGVVTGTLIFWAKPR